MPTQEPRGGERRIESARERMAEVLGTALKPVEDAPIDDETRRLMLHLSIEPPPARPEAASATPAPAAAAPSLLRRVFTKKAWQRDAVPDGGTS